MKTRNLPADVAVEPGKLREKACPNCANRLRGNRPATRKKARLSYVRVEQFAGTDQQPVWAITKKLFECET
jgi:hypothetical protein